MTHILKDLTVLPAHPHVHPETEWAIPTFAYPAVAGTHLPTSEGWKAELSCIGGYIARQGPRERWHNSPRWLHNNRIQIMTWITVLEIALSLSELCTFIQCHSGCRWISLCELLCDFHRLLMNIIVLCLCRN